MPVMLGKYFYFLIYLVVWMEKIKGNGPAGSSLAYTSTESIVIAMYQKRHNSQK